jgi:hypothetical protein
MGGFHVSAWVGVVSGCGRGWAGVDCRDVSVNRPPSLVSFPGTTILSRVWCVCVCVVEECETETVEVYFVCEQNSERIRWMGLGSGRVAGWKESKRVPNPT